MENSCIAIIPARGGSKGLPNKNVKLLDGIPLVARPIMDIKASGVPTDIYVTTDSVEIQKIAIKYGHNAHF